MASRLPLTARTTLDMVDRELKHSGNDDDSCRGKSWAAPLFTTVERQDGGVPFIAPDNASLALSQNAGSALLRGRSVCLEPPAVNSS